MAVLPCPTRSLCFDPANPFRNTSSEDGDGPEFTSIWRQLPPYVPPLGSNWVSRWCAGFTSSTVSQAEADLKAAIAGLECATETWCAVDCSGGNPPGGPTTYKLTANGCLSSTEYDIPFGSDPDTVQFYIDAMIAEILAQQEQCGGSPPGTYELSAIGCLSETTVTVPFGSDMAAIQAFINQLTAAVALQQAQCGPGTGNPPGGLPPGFPSVLYYNNPQSVTVMCPDGLPFVFTVPAGTFAALSQAEADAIAFSYAENQAPLRRLCLSNLPACIVVNQNFFNSFIVTGGVPPFTYSSSDLPNGLELSATGTLSGTPTQMGTFSFTVHVESPNGDFMDKLFSLSVAAHCDTFTNSLQSVSCPPGTEDGNHTSLPVDSNGIYVSNGTVFATAGAFQSSISQNEADTAAIIAAQNRFTQLSDALIIVCTPLIPGEPLSSTCDLGTPDNTMVGSAVCDTTLMTTPGGGSTVSFGLYAWGAYKAAYASGSWQIDATPVGPDPDDPWLVNINPGGGFDTNFEILADSVADLPKNVGLRPTQGDAQSEMVGTSSVEVTNTPTGLGAPLGPIGIHTVWQPFSVLVNASPTFNLVRTRKLAQALPSRLRVASYAPLQASLVGCNGATTDLASTQWDGTLPDFNPSPMTVGSTNVQWRADFFGGQLRVANKQMSISTMVYHHVNNGAPTATGCAWVFGVSFGPGFGSWAGYKMTGLPDSPVGDYEFRTDVAGFSLCGQLTNVRRATAAALPACSHGPAQGSVVMSVADSITVADADWTDPIPGYKIKFYPFEVASETDIQVYLDAVTGVSGLNFFLLDCNGAVIEFNFNVGEFDVLGGRLLGGSLSPGAYSLAWAAFNGPPDGLPRAFSFHTEIVSNNTPATFPGGISGLDWELTGYADGNIPIGACTPDPSGAGAWNGSFLDFSSAPPMEIWDFDGTNFPSLVSIDGNVLGAAEVIYTAATGSFSKAYWTVYIFLGNAFDDMWVGYKFDGSTPAGVYTKNRGCSAGPATLTVNQL